MTPPLLGRSDSYDQMVEAAASALAIHQGYRPNEVDPGEWGANAERFRGQAKVAIEAAFDVMEDMVPATFEGLLTILDTWYPPGVFTGSSEDVGVRLVVLAREIAQLRAQLSLLGAIDSPPEERQSGHSLTDQRIDTA